jgi:chromate transporter
VGSSVIPRSSRGSTASSPLPEPVADDRHDVSFRRVLRYFLGLGMWGFGGPIATVGYMQRDLVERNRWLEERDFLDGVALGQVTPGPLAAQVVMWVGYLRGGALGALGTATAFILPSFVAVLSLAFFYVRYQGLDWVQAIFYGVAPAVMAIIAIAAVKLARLTNGRDVRLWAISVITLVVTAITRAEIALLFIGAGVLMMLWEAWPQRGEGVAPAVWLPLLQMSAPAPGTQLALLLFFLQAGALIFGSGLAIVPFFREFVVAERGWLTEDQFLDAVAVGLITPGPVVITATFIGFLVDGFRGAAIATLAIFLPIYLGVVIPGRWFLRHRGGVRLRGFVKGATAAAAGAIAGATIVLTRGAVVDVPTAMIALTGLVLLVWLKVKEPLLVLIAAAVGLVLSSV